MKDLKEQSAWLEKIDISSRDRYTKKHGGVIWKIAHVDFQKNNIGLVSTISEEHKEIEEWNGTAEEFLERFAKIE
ncbi:hypothetical protein [Nitrosomonas sp.]|uniref:hypothetical protein n=1 Tax=Nitrosomonas sp. TaxID=42353 RepID=UPI0025ECCD79|nr:hypothetical protein [Nitrosomonas sp.]